MVDQNANLPLVEQGFRLSARQWNELVNSISGMINVSGDMIGQLRPGLFELSVKENSQLVRDVATIGLIRADDSDGAAKLEAFKPAGINEATFNTDLPNIGRRVTVCEPATAAHFGKWVIPLRDIDPGFLGPAIINGLALVKFKTLFDKAALHRVDIWGAEDVLVENAVGMGELIHDEGKGIGVEQFAFIRLAARPDNVVRVSVAAGASVGTPVYPDPNGSLVGDGIPEMIAPDDDFTGHVLIVVGKDIGGDVTEGWACTGTCLARVDEAGSPDDDFGGENGKTTLIKDETGFRSLGSVGSTGGAAYIIARPFCSHLIRADAVNSIDEQNPTTISEDDGTISHNLETSDEKKGVVHFKRGTTRLNGTDIFLSAQAVFNAVYDAGDAYLSSSLQVKMQYIVDDFDPAAAHWNLITGLTLRGSFSLIMAHDSNGIALRPQGGQTQVNIGISLPNDFFCVWHGRDFFALSAADITAGLKIHGVLLELIPDANYQFGLATATIDVPADFVDVEHVNDVGGDT